MRIKNKIRGIIFVLFLNSCGWFELEKIEEKSIGHGYKIYYDRNGIAYNQISILKENGRFLLNNCSELYFNNDYLYVNISGSDNNLEFYKIRNSDKKIVVITENDYYSNIKKENIIRYKNLK